MNGSCARCGRVWDDHNWKSPTLMFCIDSNESLSRPDRSGLYCPRCKKMPTQHPNNDWGPDCTMAP